MKKKQKLTLEELADAYVFPVTLTEAQQAEAAIQLAAARKKSQQEMTSKQRIELQLLQLKFQLEDYISSKEYDPAINFGQFLKRYIDILQLKRKTFAEDISIDETMLSQLINMHRTPPDYISIRLEIHSNNIIPADRWFKVIGLQKEHQIKTDKSLRKKERKYVHNIVAGLEQS